MDSVRLLELPDVLLFRVCSQLPRVNLFALCWAMCGANRIGQHRTMLLQAGALEVRTASLSWCHAGGADQ